MKIFRVGGYVRDKLLGIQAHDCDYVVVGGSVEEMLALGFRQIGSFFPVFLDPLSKEEYALARTERKSGVGHRGFSVLHDPSVTLEEDLSRRDLTINAIAEDHDGTLIDPFGGIADLQHGVLRHVSTAFRDDPLRILRVARFAAKLNFKVAPETLALLKEMAARGEGSTISRERTVNELQRALSAAYPQRFFEVLHASENLAVFFPSLAKALVQKSQRQAFYHDLSGAVQNPEYRYMLLALYLNAYPFGLTEISLSKCILKKMHKVQLVYSARLSQLSGAEVLQLIKKTDALRNFSAFRQLISNYRDWLLLRQLDEKLADLSLLENCVLELANLPLPKLQQSSQGAPQQLAELIYSWQLASIEKIRKQYASTTLY